MAGFLVDANLPVRLAQELSSRGFPAQHVADIPSLRSAVDDELVLYATREGLVLITKDREISFVTRSPSALEMGVVAVRIRDSLPIDEQVRIVAAAIAALDARDFAGHVVVVEPGRLRVRRGR